MRYFITGFSGFVSFHFLSYLNSHSDRPHSVFGVDIFDPCFESVFFSNLNINFAKVDLLDYSALEKTITSFMPDRILHLASFSSVAKSWDDPVGCFKNNTNIFLNLVEILRKNGLHSRVLSVGSSEEYGDVCKEDVPLVEEHPLTPVSPYAVARVSQELLSKVYSDSFGIDIVLTRSFNHIGPRQRDAFVISSFVKQICAAKMRNETTVRLSTGNVEIIRDFTDVRDVVKAYDLLFEKGKAGKFYNVCSGKGASLKEIIEVLAKLLEIDVRINIDPAKIRPNDNSIIIGSNERLRRETGWQPNISLERSLQDISDYWQKELTITKGCNS